MLQSTKHEFELIFIYLQLSVNCFSFSPTQFLVLILCLSNYSFNTIYICESLNETHEYGKTIWKSSMEKIWARWEPKIGFFATINRNKLHYCWFPKKCLYILMNFGHVFIYIVTNKMLTRGSFTLYIMCSLKNKM